MHAPKRPKSRHKFYCIVMARFVSGVPVLPLDFHPLLLSAQKQLRLPGRKKIAPKRTVSGRSKPRYHLNSTQMHDTLVSVTGEPGRPTPFRQAAPGRPSSPASERLAPTAFSLTSAGRLLLPFFAYGCKNYRLCSAVCQAFLSQRTTESAARLPSPTAAGI